MRTHCYVFAEADSGVHIKMPDTPVIFPKQLCHIIVLRAREITFIIVEE